MGPRSQMHTRHVGSSPALSLMSDLELVAPLPSPLRICGPSEPRPRLQAPSLGLSPESAGWP